MNHPVFTQKFINEILRQFPEKIGTIWLGAKIAKAYKEFEINYLNALSDNHRRKLLTRDLKIFARYYGFDGTPMTFESSGRLVGVTGVTAGRSVQRIWSRIRSIMRQQERKTNTQIQGQVWVRKWVPDTHVFFYKAHSTDRTWGS